MIKNSGFRRGQIALYVILGVVLVASVVFFVIVQQTGIPFGTEDEAFAPVFSYYQSCIEQETRLALQLAGSQGGHVFVPDYIPGNDYAPSSNHLNFLGFPVPYWSYVSASGTLRESIPSMPQIEGEVNQFVQEGLRNCDLDQFAAQGINAHADEPSVHVSVKDTTVSVQVTTHVYASNSESTGEKTSYSLVIPSKFGKFYSIARAIYKKEQTDAFFEGFAHDVLYLNAPVTGTELSCAPLFWQTQRVFGDLKTALEGNFAAIRFNGKSSGKTTSADYFAVDVPTGGESVNVLYSSEWPTKIEVNGEGVDEALMRADPVGTQPGLGMLGFCYVPYHFLYDLSFPVMIQVYNADELFQFPLTAVIENNVPRQTNETRGFIEASSQEDNVCAFLTQPVEISVVDFNLHPVDGNVTYECFNQDCRLGQTRNGKLSTMAPACVNGYLKVRAGGYTEQKQLFSTNEERFADVVLEREFPVNVSLRVGGSPLKGTAVVSFTRSDGERSVSVALPYSSTVLLSEGMYDVRVYVYDNSSITLPASTTQQCVTKPKEGLLGFFGSTEEECFDVTIPETKLEYALIGGGTAPEYFVESQLEKGTMELRAPVFARPTSLDMLQKNFEQFDANPVEVTFHA